MISQQQRARFRRDGVILLQKIFDDQWVSFLEDAIDLAMNNPGPGAEMIGTGQDQGGFFGDLELAERLAPFRQFVMQSPAAEIAGRVMRASRINFFYDQLLVKEPGATARTPWHQDQPYWAVSGRQVCSIWMPVDPVPESAAIEFVRGSHEWPEYSPYHFADGSPYADTGLPMLPDIESNRDAYDIVRYAMEPGDCLVFQAMIVHGAPGNPGSGRRRALSTRWAGDDARYCVRPGEVAIPSADPGLEHGQRLDSNRFPLVWQSEK